MSAEVLKAKSEIGLARTELCRRGLSFTSSWWRRLASNLGISDAINVGDELKSWDVLKSVHFMEDNTSKSAPILDIGAYASELPSILHDLHYSNLTGVDLNPNVKKMPYAGDVHYEASDFMHTPFKSESFEAITAISVIEHGFDGKALLAEVSRLLRPGGYFIASFDYWPEKVDTSGTSVFGMDWKIFSEQEVRGLLDDATHYNLCPYGAINLDAREKVIHCADKDYTFAWLALQKNPINGGVQS